MDMLMVGYAIILGVLATLFMDGFAWIRLRYFHVTSFNYALFGRWILYGFEGKFIHQNILALTIKKSEALIGWVLHYCIGIIFSFAYFILDERYNLNFSLSSVLIFSLSTTLFAFIIMQPALGFGFFASKTAKQSKSIQNSIVAHTAFGIGLFLAYHCTIFF